MASNITITFNNPAQSGDILQIQDSYTPTVLIDIQFGTTGLSLPITGDIAEDLLNVLSFIENSYNVSNRYLITKTSSTITLTDNIGSSNFTEDSNNTSGRLTTTIVNEPVSIGITIDDVTLIENTTDPCLFVDIEITTNQQATDITSPIVQSVSTNPFTITDINRDSINDIVITLNDSTSNATQSIYVPILNSAIFDLQIIQSPSSSVLNVLWLGSKEPYFNIQYSLDNVTYFDSNSFSGLVEGNYTMYIKDDIGCSISIPFEVTEFEPNVFERLPYFQVSDQNSLITVKRENINGYSIFRNPTNTLSYEEQTKVNSQNFKQLFQNNDGVITQQYRSNYETVTIKLIDCDNNEVILPSTKKTQNFDITDVRDATILPVDYMDLSFVGVQYTSGNTYDPDTLAVTGEYNLGVLVPSFMNIDDYVQIQGAGWFRVKDIIFYNEIETLVLDALVNTFLISVENQTLRVTSIYNILPYEVFEFSVDLSTLNGDYYITYNATDSEFEELNYRTEYFNVLDNQPWTYVLDYYNSENNETNYSTGITNKIRIPYIKQITHLGSLEQDVYLTDTNAVGVEASNRDFYLLDIYAIPLGFKRKIISATSNDRLFLNGLSLLRNSELDNDEKIGFSNLYNISIQFVRSDYVFTSVANDGSITLPTGQPLGISGDSDGLLFAN